jgi:hydroxyacylglutathione hydrolase
MRYTVILEQEQDGGYVASVPALPGCVSQGDTRAEALNNIREAIELYVEDCRDAGDPIPTKQERSSLRSRPRRSYVPARVSLFKFFLIRFAPPMSKAKAIIVPVTPFQQNCTLLWCEASKRGVVIDPGGDLPQVDRAIAQAGVAVDKIWLTHGHIDHAGGAADLKASRKVSIEGPHRADLFLLQHLAETGRSFGIWNASNVTPDRWLQDGDQVEVGELKFDVLHCPGHSPGSVVYFNPQQRLAIVGDVLFAGSIGRTDLPGGDHRQLLASIRDKLLPLADDVVIISGHGPTSTIGRERATNPFLQ